MTKRITGTVLPALSLVFLISCQAFADSPDKPRGDERALAVYNQAYQENYDPDSMEVILAEAEGAYVLIDPFDPDQPVSASDIAALRAAGNLVSAYMSVGTGEDWRSDFDSLRPYLADDQWGDWAGEYYVSRLDSALVDLMKARIDRAGAMGFNWLEFDNMDWIFDSRTRDEYNLQATAAEGKAYLRELYDYAASKGMKCMSKNLRADAEYYDGITWESYSDEKNWWNEEELLGFLNEGKPVVIIHYGERNAGRAWRAYDGYMELYGRSLSFIAETREARGYIHFND